MEILRLYINLTEINEVVSDSRTAKMLLFNGTCKSDIFNGTILNACRLFIENNAKIGTEDASTHPMIITDSQELKWLENANLVGHIVHEDGQLMIVIEKIEN